MDNKLVVPTVDLLIMKEEEDLFADAKEIMSKLSPKAKLALIQQEALKDPSLRVVLGGVMGVRNFITAEIVLQVQSGEVDVVEILKAAASRVQADTNDCNGI